MSDSNQPQPCPGHVVDCSNCNGTGKRRGWDPIEDCKPCKGVGKVVLH